MIFSQTQEFRDYVNSHTGSKTLVMLTCPTCGFIFNNPKNDTLSKLSKGREYKCCSNQCLNVAKGILKKTSCAQCGIYMVRAVNEISESGNVFCSSSCAATFNGHAHPKRIKAIQIDKVAGIPKQQSCCKHCRADIPSGKTYCNTLCASKGRRVTDLALAKTDATRRKLLIHTRGHACEVCHTSEWNGLPIAIELDHIDGNSDNNEPTNLKLICPNCHAQTVTYKGANQGNSKRQVMRRQRYADGKTF